MAVDFISALLFAEVPLRHRTCCLCLGPVLRLFRGASSSPVGRKGIIPICTCLPPDLLTSLWAPSHSPHVEVPPWLEVVKEAREQVSCTPYFQPYYTYNTMCVVHVVHLAKHRLPCTMKTEMPMPAASLTPWRLSSNKNTSEGALGLVPVLQKP